MATNYPTSLDTFTNPVATDLMNSSTVPHHTQHDNINDSVAALETKVGVDGSAVTTTIDYKLKNTASVDPGHKHTTSSISGTVATAQGGTGLSAIGTADQLLGVTHPGGALEYKTITAGTNITVTPAAGSITITSTALSNPMTTLGDTMYGGTGGAATRLAGDTSNTRKFLREQSSGGVAAAPAWDTIQSTDVPVFVASGASHAQGLVPDPGSTAGTTRYLREDATWQTVSAAPPAIRWATGQSNGGSSGQTWNSGSYSTATAGMSSTNSAYGSIIRGPAAGGDVRLFQVTVDPATNLRTITRFVQPTTWFAHGLGSTQQMGCAVVGSNVYYTFYDVTNAAFSVYQYTTSLGTQTLMTNGATVPGNAVSNAFSDNTNLYIYSGSGDVYYKYSISGTTLTYVTSITYTGISTGRPWSDGTNVWALTGTTINKWALAGGSATAGATVSNSQNDTVCGIAGLGSFLDTAWFDNAMGTLATNPPSNVPTYLTFAPVQKN